VADVADVADVLSDVLSEKARFCLARGVGRLRRAKREREREKAQSRLHGPPPSDDAELRHGFIQDEPGIVSVIG